MKYIILLLFVVSSIGAKDTNSISYDAPGAFFVYYAADHTEVFRKPFGKEIEIYYDTFFKSYTLIYTNSEGRDLSVKFDYTGENQEQHCTYATDNGGGKWYIYDDLKNHGFLRIFNSEQSAGRDWCILIENAILRK